MFQFTKYVLGVAITLALLSLPFFISSAGTTDPTVAIIVQLRDDPGAVYHARAEQSGAAVSPDQLQAYRNQLAAKQTEFLNSLTAKGVTFTVNTRAIKGFDGNVAGTIAMRYTLVLNGVALDVPASAINSIRAMPNVKSVSPVETLTANLRDSVSYIRAPQVYGDGDEIEISKKGYVPSGTDNLGQSVNVSVIDTGVDWTHPMFGGDANPPRLGIYPEGVNGGGTGADNFNKKVIYYIPFTDIAVQDGFGHGTHVAATIAGYWQQLLSGERIHGVAPQAKIMSYKVCSDIQSTVSQVVPIGGCDSANIIMALEDSVSPTTLPTIQSPAGAISNPATALFSKPVAKVINMSLGGSGGPNNPTALAASNASLLGAVVVAASGNSGPGEGTTGSPAAGTHVISVGATTHPGSASLWSVDMAGHQRIPLLPMQGTTQPTSSITANYVYVDSWSELGPFPASVRGRIALVKDWAGTTFADMSAQATAAGAVALIFIRDEGANAVRSNIPAALVSIPNGDTMIKALSASDNDLPANGAVSDNQITLNGFLSNGFMGEMAGFSSRGPVRGFGQIKPDVSAPGVAVLAAVPPGSLLGALAAAGNPLTPNYIRIDGTSMASPHVAGAAVLIKQAHKERWKPDVVRTVLINTSTNMRDSANGPKADGTSTADSIISQGGGLIDVYHAINAKAMMGITGDGINTPRILGSHSFGEVPVVNNRITHTVPVTVTVSDLTGEGGTYNLNVANNRDLQLAGINVSLSQSSVNLPAGGSTTFTVQATFDGDAIRDVMAAKTNGSEVIFERIQMQWFVTAIRSDNKESLRMPFYFRPGSSLPAQPIIQTLNQTATVPVGDVGNQLVGGATYVDVPFNVSDSTYKIDALVEWFSRPTGSVEDIDYLLLDPDGNTIASSGNVPGASESVSVRVNRAGTYTHRLVGYANVATSVTIATTLSKGPNAPAAQAFAGDFQNAQSQQVDFDGNVTLNWTPAGGELSYEVEKLNSETSEWEMVVSVPGGTTSHNFTGLADGSHSFRVRGIHPGQIGKFATNSGNEVSVLVSARSKVDITNLVSYPILTASFSGGVWQQDFVLMNNSTNTYLPFVDFNIIGVNSASGNVRVINADNSKDGRTPANAALFGFTDMIGSDQVFSPSETTAPRTVRFQNTAGEMFFWDVQVTAYVGTGGSAGASQAQTEGGSQSASSGSGLTDQLPLTKVTGVTRFTANPLTKKVTATFVKLN